MGVRNCAEIGENLQKIVKRLMANNNLVNLLYYTDKDPLSQPHLTEEQKTKEVFEKLIKIVPNVEAREDEKSVIAIRVTGGNRKGSNIEFRNVKISIEVFVPMTAWIIKDTNLRPFAILGEIENSLQGKAVNGLGKIEGGFDEVQRLLSRARTDGWATRVGMKLPVTCTKGQDLLNWISIKPNSTFYSLRYDGVIDNDAFPDFVGIVREKSIYKKGQYHVCNQEFSRQRRYQKNR